ncbi:MAG: hypothetical protein GQE15_07075 [Archangiaceae bacterium]|nr:hypothetical protein [Archangiaceae bacterium]
MPKPISLQKATRELEAAVAGEPQQLWKVWPALPEGLPLSLVSRAMKRIVERNHDVGVIGRALPSAYIDTFLEVLAQKPAWPLVVAARSVVNVEASRRSVVLGRVLKCVEQLGVFSASRSQLEARVRVFVKDEHVVEAARQIVLHATFDELREFHRLMFVSLLMEDASEASMDALIAEAHEATKSAERIDRLRECLRWRKTPSPRLEPPARAPARAARGANRSRHRRDDRRVGEAGRAGASAEAAEGVVSRQRVDEAGRALGHGALRQ